MKKVSLQKEKKLKIKKEKKSKINEVKYDWIEYSVFIVAGIAEIFVLCCMIVRIFYM